MLFCWLYNILSKVNSSFSELFNAVWKAVFQWLLKQHFSYLCKSQNIQMEVSYLYSNQTLRHALYMFDHTKWNTSYVSCCFNYSLILSCISPYIFVIKTKPFVNFLPMLIFILLCGFVVCLFVLAISLGKRSPTWTI